MAAEPRVLLLGRLRLHRHLPRFVRLGRDDHIVNTPSPLSWRVRGWSARPPSRARLLAWDLVVLAGLSVAGGLQKSGLLLQMLCRGAAV